MYVQLNKVCVSSAECSEFAQYTEIYWFNS